MSKQKLYTAVGRLDQQAIRNGERCPMIILAGKEYWVDPQELVIWTSLSWRFAKWDEIHTLYQKAVKDTGMTADRTWQDCVKRLLTRGLLVSGSGETDYDALYDLIAPLHIVPICGSILVRIYLFFKLLISRDVPFRSALRLFRRDKHTKDEKSVINLTRHTSLSTAEVICCVEKGIYRLRRSDDIMEKLYCDNELTSDNIVRLAKNLFSTEDMVLAIANLFLRQQILFERV